VNIANQFQKVVIFLAENGLVAILEKMTASAVPPIVADGVPRQNPPHYRRNRILPGSQKQVEMIRHQSPSQTSSSSFLKDSTQPIDKVVPVRLILEDIAPLNTPRNDVMERARRVNS
jgi:hypothetical protein